MDSCWEKMGSSNEFSGIGSRKSLVCLVRHSLMNAFHSLFVLASVHVLFVAAAAVVVVAVAVVVYESLEIDVLLDEMIDVIEQMMDFSQTAGRKRHRKNSSALSPQGTYATYWGV